MPKSDKTKKTGGKHDSSSATVNEDSELDLLDELLEDEVPTVEVATIDDLTTMNLFSSGKSSGKKSVDQSLAVGVKANPVLIERGFTSDDQQKLSENEHMRFMRNAETVGHALVTKSQDGRIIAQQFSAPGSSDPTDPRVATLKDIEIFEDKYGNRHARALADDGTEMISKRSVDVKTTDQHGDDIQHELLFFSPKAMHIWRGDVFWGSNPMHKPALFRDDLPDRQKRELQKEMSEAKVDIRGGEIELVNADVVKREDAKRNPTQNKVMGQSAVDAYEAYYDMYKDELSSDMKTIIKKSIDARPHVRNMGPKGQPRPEWLHALGFGLYPMSGNPQTADNLGAAPKWLNTKMMTTERALKWHAMHRPDAKLTLSCRYKMLPHSDIIDEGKITGTFVEADNQVILSQHLNPHQKYPVYSTPTDLMQTTLVTHHLLTNTDPGAVVEAKIDTRSIKNYSVVNQTGGYVMGASIPVQSAHNEVSSSNSVSVQATAAVHATEPPKIDDLTITDNASLRSIDLSLPQTLSYEKSVVKIFSTFQDPDYEMPWLGSITNKCTGSGFVIEEDGRHYIVTNAHVVDSSNYLEVRLANDDRVFTAAVKQVCHQGDMALLEIEDEEFQAITEPVVMGEMAKMQEEVKAVGFPMGGEEISITKGIVSRIEVDIYAQSGERMLQVQTDSAINPGNSGGPVFCNGKLTGIAFQGNDRGEGLGYFIPTPVLQHFLKDAFSGASYKGFATLNIALQPLTNPGLRDYFGLDEKQTGVRVTTVDELSDVKGKLLQDDIILAIDGFKVGNDAKVTVPEVGSRLDLNYLFQRKHIGENINLSVLRKNQGTQQVQQFNVSAELKWRPGQTKKVEAPEHEKDPTYYINSGVVFQPLTNNFLETRKGSILASVIIPTVGYISDIPKKSLDEQFVVINSVLDSKKTRGYGDFECSLVDEINGVKIRHIRDAVQAMESHKGSHHKIKLIDQDIIVLENMSEKEHRKLLKQYRIHDDRSDDLKSLPLEAGVINKEAEKGKEKDKLVAPIVANSDNAAQAAPKKKRLRKLRRVIMDSDSEGDSTVEADEKQGLMSKLVSAVKPNVSIQKAERQQQSSLLLDSLSNLMSDSDGTASDSDETEVAAVCSDDDLFNGGADSEDEYDYNDPFIVDDEVDSKKGYKNLMGDYRIPKQSMLQMADKSGKDFTMAELSFMDTIDRIAKRAGLEGTSDLSESSDSSSESSSTLSESDVEITKPRKLSKRQSRSSQQAEHKKDTVSALLMNYHSDSDLDYESDSSHDSSQDSSQDSVSACSRRETKEDAPVAEVESTPPPSSVSRRSRRLQGLNP
tara:strand:- start:44110 stop:48060 length:3951 start_codon:yes stop_codon:yes gene_type:complete